MLYHTVEPLGMLIYLQMRLVLILVIGTDSEVCLCQRHQRTGKED